MERTETGADRLLLVDDDEAFSRVLGRALERRGYIVAIAATPAEACEKNRHWAPRYAVVDLKLGAESGLDLIPELKARNPDLTIVVLTGYASIATAVAAVKRGAADYLAKPIKADDIVQALSGKEQQPTDADDYTPMSVERVQWEHIQKVLSENDGNISATARSLGMYRRTLQRKLAKKPVAE
ncbi:MAG: response regulator transcription factor [Lysobacterales bacterium]